MIFAQTISKTKYELVGLENITTFWHFALLLVVCLAVAAAVIWLYRRDTRDLHWGVALSLMALRLFAFAGLLFTYLDLERGTQREVVQNSRAVILVDASQSMALDDVGTDEASAGATGQPGRRIDQVVQQFSEGKMLDDLRQHHDVTVMRFDESETATEIASLPKLNQETSTTKNTRQSLAELTTSLGEARLLFGVAAVLLAVALIGSMVYVIARRPESVGPSLGLLAGTICLMVGVVILAVANLRNPDVSLSAIVGQEDVETLSQRLAAQDETDESTTEQESPTQPATPTVDWATRLTPAGSETRLGEALMDVINKERGGPIAGVILISDGRNNAGLPHTDAMLQAKDAGIPLYPIGLGSPDRVANISLVDIEAPQRVYPGDRFNVKGFIQATAIKASDVHVQLISFPQGQEDNPQQQRREDEITVALGADGEITPVSFEIETPEVSETRVYRLQLDPPKADRNQRDNAKSTPVQIIERRTHVLLLAGGPTREFRFLRNQLYRDEEILVDVHLQTGKPGISQEADELLFDFPDNEDDLFKYDAIVAFDPDWEALDVSQIRLIERWVDKQAGGLIVVAGPIYTPLWSKQRRGDLAIDLLKGLYPVTFSELFQGKFKADSASPLEFTREGLEAEFLWLAESAPESRDNWEQFEGVFGYYAVKDIKPGATVYAHFLNQDEAIGDNLPVYFAGQYYGAGRVFFMASGEMWRLRRFDDSYFETFYTKLIRHVAQGRLLRDSKRGVLMVDNRRAKLGDQITIRAQLNDPQHRPLDAEDHPQVTLDVQLPDGSDTTIVLRNVNVGSGPDLAGREGMYTGQLPAIQQGDYTLKLTVPESGDEEVLMQQVAVRAPLKEIEQPQRNDELLSELATATEGYYFRGLEPAARAGQTPSVSQRMESRDRLTPLADLPDKEFERRLMWWQLGLICGALCLEWLIRRLSKLA